MLGSRPGSAALSARNILGQDIHSHRLRSTKPFIPPGSINLVPASAGVNSYRDSVCECSLQGLARVTQKQGPVVGDGMID